MDSLHREHTIGFLEPMEETVYLDQVKLLAIDHPARLDVYPNERFASDPPFPQFGVVPKSNAHLPVGAWDDRGNDVLSLLAKRDRKYVTSFDELPFAGFAKLHWIELDLGNWNPRLPLRLIADVTGKIPAGTRRIRIVNNLKIYWDAIRIDQTTEQRNVRVTEVPLANASLDFLGYPKEIRLQPASDTVYSYSKRSMTGPYARAAGNYTRYGDVKSLLRAADDRFVIFSSGEGLKLDFYAKSLPALPSGWVRDYFFYADGFEKDMG